MNKKISVIVPVYNGETYLNRCIESILGQKDFDVKDLEIITINDGSTDTSLQIIREYEIKHPNVVRVIDQKNIGVAKTRDKAVNVATGEYIMFIDQDDYIDSDYCATLYGESKSEKYDIIMCGFKRPGANKRIINKQVKLKNTPYAKYVITGVFPKLHRTAFIKKNNIHAFHTVYGEDIGFVLHEYQKTNKIKVVKNYSGYNWFYNKSSVSNTLHKQMIDVLPLCIEMLKKIKSYDVGTSEYEYYILQTVVAYMLWAGRSAGYDDFMYAYRTVFSWLYENYPNINKNKHVWIGPKGAPTLNRLAISGFMFLHRIKLVGAFSRLYCRG